MNFKLFQIVIILLLANFTIFAQQTAPKPWNVEAGYTPLKGIGSSEFSFDHQFNLAGGVKIRKFIEVGGYSTLSNDLVYRLDLQTGLPTETKDVYFQTFGVYSKFYPLPLLLKSARFSWLEPYVIASTAARFSYASAPFYPHGYASTEYVAGGGLALYTGKHFGFYGEWQIGNFRRVLKTMNFRYDYTRINIGIKLRFRE